jgi:hypothetical protein
MRILNIMTADIFKLFCLRSGRLRIFVLYDILLHFFALQTAYSISFYRSANKVYSRDFLL